MPANKSSITGIPHIPPVSTESIFPSRRTAFCSLASTAERHISSARSTAQAATLSETFFFVIPPSRIILAAFPIAPVSSGSEAISPKRLSKAETKPCSFSISLITGNTAFIPYFLANTGARLSVAFSIAFGYRTGMKTVCSLPSTSFIMFSSSSSSPS